MMIIKIKKSAIFYKMVSHNSTKTKDKRFLYSLIDLDEIYNSKLNKNHKNRTQ